MDVYLAIAKTYPDDRDIFTFRILFFKFGGTLNETNAKKEE